MKTQFIARLTCFLIIVSFNQIVSTLTRRHRSHTRGHTVNPLARQHIFISRHDEMNSAFNSLWHNGIYALPGTTCISFLLLGSVSGTFYRKPKKKLQKMCRIIVSFIKFTLNIWIRSSTWRCVEKISNHPSRRGAGEEILGSRKGNVWSFSVIWSTRSTTFAEDEASRRFNGMICVNFSGMWSVFSLYHVFYSLLMVQFYHCKYVGMLLHASDRQGLKWEGVHINKTCHKSVM